jgi:hypothetical protein
MKIGSVLGNSRREMQVLRHVFRARCGQHSDRVLHGGWHAWNVCHVHLAHADPPLTLPSPENVGK